MDTSSRSSRMQYRSYLRRRKGGGTQSAENPGSMPPPVDYGPHAIRSTKRSRSFYSLFKRFLGLLRGHRLLLSASLTSLGIGTLLGLVPLYGTKLVFDNVLDNKSLPPVGRLLHLSSDPVRLLATVCISMISVTVLAVAFTTFSRWQCTRVAKRLIISSRRKAFAHAVHLPLHRVQEMKAGGVASILREDAGSPGELVFSLLYNPWQAVIQLLGCLFVLTTVDWRLLLGSLALLPTVWLTHRTWIGRIRPIWRDIRSTRQRIDSHATESFSGMRVVRSFSRQQSEARSFIGRNGLMTRQEVFAWWWSRGIDIAWAVIIPLASALLLWYGGTRILHDMAAVKAGTLDQHKALTTGDLVMFLSYLASLLGPIAALAASATGLQNNLAGLDRVIDLLDEPLEMPDRPGAVSLRRNEVRGHITFENVSFHYPGNPAPILEGINLDITEGQMVALVGPSGAGKTTICNLVARFYDPTAGRLCLDGVDLRDIKLGHFRRLLGIVEQDTFLFDGSIADNIRYGRRHASMDQVIEASQQANAHEFIQNLAKGYDTMIGERGVKLSGGQRQRLTIARAILADPRILILDEATSNLDTESERLIQSSLQSLMRGRTSFVIAHRLSTIRHADRIVVIEKGRIVETGDHQQLMAQSGRYQSMVMLQTQPPEPQRVAGRIVDPSQPVASHPDAPMAGSSR